MSASIGYDYEFNFKKKKLCYNYYTSFQALSLCFNSSSQKVQFC